MVDYKLYKEKDGRRYVKIARKKHYIKSELSDNELLKSLTKIINKLVTRRRARKVVAKKAAVPKELDITRMDKLASYNKFNPLSDRVAKPKELEKPALPAPPPVPMLPAPIATPPHSPVIIRSPVSRNPTPENRFAEEDERFHLVDTFGEHSPLKLSQKQKNDAIFALEKSAELEQKAKEAEDKSSSAIRDARVAHRAAIISRIKTEISEKALQRWYKQSTGLTKALHGYDKILKVLDVKMPGFGYIVQHFPLHGDINNLIERLDEDASAVEDERENQHVSEDEDVGVGEGLNDSNGLWNTDINALMSPYTGDGYLGTCAIDTLKDMSITGDCSFVMNVMPLSAHKVGHWVAIKISTAPNVLEYYDPYGLGPNDEFRDTIRTMLRKLSDTPFQFKINRVQFQPVDSHDCGWFCVMFLTARYDGKPFKEVSGFDRIDQSKMGEQEVTEFKKRYKDFDTI